MLGTLDGGRLALEEIHRFSNGPVRVEGALHWNLAGLFEALHTGLRQAAARRLPIASISTDSWGVDYVLLDDQERIIEPTFHYRDRRTARGVERVRANVDWPTIFAETGIQFMPLNTIYQLAAESPDRLARARQVLLIGDAFNHHLSGVAKNEESLASTTQLYNPRTRQWSARLLQALGLPARLFGPVIPSGTRLGPLREGWARASGLDPIEVVATCSHDTGAAVAAVPAADGSWAYLSSGTWSLMGMELLEPILTDACREHNFTNELGYGGTVRLLKNIIGMWLVQESKREWARAGRDYTYDQLEQMAMQAPPFVSLINPSDPRFLAPDDMPEKIASFCRDTGQPAPQEPGAVIRCVFESLALLYRRTLRQAEQLTGQTVNRLHIVGGGSRNVLLNRFAADALQIPIVAGPKEATAIGNVLIQAIALGHLGSLAEGRAIVRHSFESSTIQPGDGRPWDTAFARFENLL
jgi:rhamnulokinase